MKQIRDRNIISSYIISFEYLNDNEGLIVLGKYLHECFPEKYKEINYKSFYSYQPRTMFLTNFVINFDEIYSYNNKEKYFLQKTTRTNIILNIGVIIGTNEYMQFIMNNYFNKYINNNNTCEMNFTSDDFFNSFIILACNDNQNFNIKEFPPLIFYIKSENITFEFTYKDLFKKIDDKYYFLIIFEKYVTGYWRFGKPFYKKYTFVYNGDAKTIGFYLDKNSSDDHNDKNQNKNKENNDKNWKLELNTLKIIIIFVLLLIVISLVITISYFAGKKCNEKRRKYANELDDDNFEYTINNYNS